MIYTIRADKKTADGWAFTTIALEVGAVVGGWCIADAPFCAGEHMAVCFVATDAGCVGDLVRLEWGGYGFRPHVNPFQPESVYANRWVFPVEAA
jgi:hypothetical protein